MTQFGYARVSTKGQSLADQINQLKSAGADKILAEKFTGTTTSRPQFDKLIKLVKPGDTITVTKLVSWLKLFFLQSQKWNVT